MTATPATTADLELDREREDLLESFRMHRWFLTYTLQGLSDEQAATRTTVSELTLSGILHHLIDMEEQWTGFIVDGPDRMTAESATYTDPDADHSVRWRLRDGQSLAEALEEYAALAARTEELVRSLPSLDADQPLPVAPWFQPGARWSARRVVLHLIAETAQHAGHADIIRESLDGQKTMG
jgi:uncharacterized damage-inducible protein DinB